MSYYKHQEFIDPEPLYAEIKETLRSYFESGAVDDLLFQRWTENCLSKFQMSAYNLGYGILEISGKEAYLPEDFEKIREVWVCSKVEKSALAPASFYYQKDVRTSLLQDACMFEDIPHLSSDPVDHKYRVVHKVSNEVVMTFSFGALLKPGNLRTKNFCGEGCENLASTSPYIFDIYDGKIVTNFDSGTLYISYYTNTRDEQGTRLIPKDPHIQEHLKNYIIYKIFEFLFHQVTDESLSQISSKLQYYKQQSDSTFIAAMNSLKLETVHDKVRSIVSMKNRYNHFKFR